MADLTITLTPAHIARLQAAIEEAYQPVDGNGDPRPATVEDARDIIKTYLIEFVLNSERVVATETAVAAIVPIDPT